MSILAALLTACGSVSSAFAGVKITPGSTGNSINLLLPSGAAAGDRAVYTYIQDGFNAGSLSSNGGASATHLAFGQYGNMRAGAWEKTLTSTDITNGYIQLTFTSGLADQATGVVGLWRGGSPTVSLVGQTDSGGADSTSITLANPSGTADYLAHGFLDDDLTTVSSWPTSYTQGRDQSQVGSSGSGGTGACAVALNSDPGAETFVFNSSDETIGIVIKVVT